MKKVQLVNVTRGLVVASEVLVADGIFSRMKGLLGRSGLESSEGLWITPCNSIHMFGMRFPIDALFLSKEKLGVKMVGGLQVGEMLWPVWSAYSVVELKSGRLVETGCHEGDKFDLLPC